VLAFTARSLLTALQSRLFHDEPTGPLLSSDGKVIGMNEMIFSTSGGSQGVGFAIPIDTVKVVVDQIIKHGHAVRPSLGISVAPDFILQQMRVEGVLVGDVLSALARESGLKPSYRDEYGNLVYGDIITKVDNAVVKSAADLQYAIGQHSVGDTVTLHLLRPTGGRQHRSLEVFETTVTITISAVPTPSKL
jgi:S1-C subfamily serine protease